MGCVPFARVVLGKWDAVELGAMPQGGTDMVTEAEALNKALKEYRAAGEAVKVAQATHNATINDLNAERKALVDRIVQTSPERAQLATLDAALKTAKTEKRKQCAEARAELRAASSELESVVPSVLAVGDTIQAHGLAVSYVVKVAKAK